MEKKMTAAEIMGESFAIMAKHEEAKIAVFTTSDIQYFGFGGNNTARTFCTGTKGLVSTGKLERAIEQGYTVYVVSTRHTLSETDAWWRAFVPDERIFLTSENEMRMDGGYANSQSTITPWERLYEVLGLPIPKLSLSDMNRANEIGMTERAFACWQEAQYELESHGVMLGNSF